MAERSCWVPYPPAPHPEVSFPQNLSCCLSMCTPWNVSFISSVRQSLLLGLGKSLPSCNKTTTFGISPPSSHLEENKLAFYISCTELRHQNFLVITF